MKNEIVIDGVEYVKKDTIKTVSEDGNTGNGNTGNRNTGDGNTGDRNTGYWNTGDGNTGDWNTGYGNTGDRNTGNGNTGDGNTGNGNTGYGNTGDWNTGDGNTGFLNTVRPKVRIFNMDCDIARDDLEFPNYFYFDITEWIPEEAMTDEEKVAHDTYKTTGGYLRSYEYQEAFRKSWKNASDEDRRKTLTLPNWNNELFLKELSIKSNEYSMDEVAKALGVDVKKLKIRKV
ncbi:MAG: hypothetical protein UT94_C0024G0003 [Candidatus Uhrbacteria bacterium GW2011_GWF2_40_263]|nr:MAG: hypothetical protein UT94_C0024G0003 [Candidatus Uhrbacteria bacterium GW2011_GWF2_40_263]